MNSDTLNDVEAISELQEKCVEKRKACENDEKDHSCANNVSNTSICVENNPCNGIAVVDNQRTDENDVGAENKEKGYMKWEMKKIK